MDYLELLFADVMRRRAMELLHVDFNDESGIEFSAFVSSNYNEYLKEAILEVKKTAGELKVLSTAT